MSAEAEFAQGAATVLNAADALPPIAMGTTLASMVEIPAAGLCLTQMIDGFALPGGLGGAALKWAQAGEKLDEAKRKLKEVTEAIPSDAWSSDDRKAFDQKLDQLGTQFETTRVFADATGTALLVSGSVLAAYDVFITIIGAELLVQAIMIFAEEVSVIGDLGPAEAQMAEANATAVELAEDIKGTNATLKTVATATAKALGAAEFLHFDGQLLQGNNTLVDILKGSVVALPEIALSALLGKAGEKGASKLLGKFAGKDLDEAAEEASKEAIKVARDARVGKDAADAADNLSKKATQAAEEDLARGAPHASTQLIGAGHLTEAAGKAAEESGKAAHDAAGKAANATLKGIDGTTHHAVKQFTGHAGEYSGQHSGEEGGSWIDKMLNGE
jgi:hypothetical protein